MHAHICTTHTHNPSVVLPSFHKIPIRNMWSFNNIFYWGRLQLHYRWKNHTGAMMYKIFKHTYTWTGYETVGPWTQTYKTPPAPPAMHRAARAMTSLFVSLFSLLVSHCRLFASFYCRFVIEHLSVVILCLFVDVLHVFVVGFGLCDSFCMSL